MNKIHIQDLSIGSGLNINQKIEIGLELSIDSKVPMFIFSNPGVGKTTTLQKWCEKNDYELLTLIGSQYQPDEVLGFPVHDKEGSVVSRALPNWFYKIKKSDKKILLFLDELTTSTERVQGALLSLIFDRRIENNVLPESTVIVSAGNYQSNLSYDFNLLGPLVNRFMILDLKVDSKIDLPLFLQGKVYREIERDSRNVSEKVISECLLNLVYSLEAENHLDMNDADYSRVYTKNLVNNKVTPRSLHYAKLVIKSYFSKFNEDRFFVHLLSGLLPDLQKKSNSQSTSMASLLFNDILKKGVESADTVSKLAEYAKNKEWDKFKESYVKIEKTYAKMEGKDRRTFETCTALYEKLTN